MLTLTLHGQSLGMGIGNQPEDIKRGGRLYNLDEDIGEYLSILKTDLLQNAGIA